MKFTQQQLDILKKCWEQEKEITIKGITNLGEKFNTTGRIATTDDLQAALADEGVWVEFGKTKYDEEVERTIYFAPFITEMRQWAFLEDFCVFAIEVDGKCIYENSDKEKWISLAEENKRRHDIKYKDRKYHEVIDCPVMKALKNMIGKPIYLTDYSWDDGDCGVYLGVDFIARTGCPMIKYRKGREVELNLVMSTTKLMTENNNGEKITLAQNNAEAFNEELEKLLPSKEKLENYLTK